MGHPARRLARRSGGGGAAGDAARADGPGPGCVQDARHRDRRGLLRSRARAVGRRQQRGRDRTRRGRLLRAQLRHQHRAPQGWHRGDHDRGLRARQGPRWRPLHDLPTTTRPGILSLRRHTAMAFNLKNRSFLKEIDFQPRELGYLLKLSEALKLAKYAGTEVKHLEGKEIALIFEKTSTRTRSAFEVGAYDQGAHVTYLDPSGSQLGHKESIADTAAVLGRMYDAIEFRGNSQADVEELAAHAGVPVYNGLTNEWHPTQMLADFLTMHEASGKPYHALTYAFVGDCRFNMGRSLLVTGALLGSDVRLSGPAELYPPKDVVDLAHDIAGRTGARITVTEDPREAVSGADFIHTDVWVSMGEAKDVWADRVKDRNSV